MSKQEEKVIQPQVKRVEIVIPSTEVRKKGKIGAASEASRGQNGSLVERACGCFCLVMSGYARVEHRCRCAQAAMERRLSSRGAERQCLYQRAMVTLFHDMIHRGINYYVDDMIAKSHTEVGHLVDRGKSFDRLRQFKLRLNLDECTVRVRSGCLPTETVYAGSYHFVDCQDGSDQKAIKGYCRITSLRNPLRSSTDEV
ncbi:hypothetical protein KIW84_056400 [Lathyrus oleraceus]|uniref:Uncharacterized protein n=1 Tax=Pisum sativum TaxID=3888 RepID=A0A9D4X333_PEA|nr:hypothetical protein KIW84_056400 [Pisum sativum]